MFYGEYAEEYFEINSPDVIFRACKKVFNSVLKEDPERFDRKGTELTKKYEGLELLGLDPNDEILGKFYAKKNNIVCAIVRSICAENTIFITTIHVNFYKINEHGEGEAYKQVIICSGTASCIFAQGDPGEIQDLIQALNPEGSDEEDSHETLTGFNKSEMAEICGSLFIIGCGSVYFLKRNNLI